MKPYVIDAITGNGKILAQYSATGELVRLFFPRIDQYQIIDRHWLGVKYNEKLTWFNEGENYTQRYLGDTPVLETSFTLAGLKVTLTDMALPEKAVLVRKVKLLNPQKEALHLNLYYLAETMLGEQRRYQTTEFKQDMLWQYYDKNYLLIFSPGITGFQCGDTENFSGDKPNGNLLSMDGKGLLEVKVEIPAEGSAEVEFVLALGETKALAQENLKYYLALGFAQAFSKVLEYWQNILCRAYEVKGSPEEIALYRRSIITMFLLRDPDYGSIVAAPEFDEDFQKSGGYAYCWGRDAAFIVTALDYAGYHQEARSFYKWAAKIQEPHGGWEQRYYLDGKLAPNWGIQIDETGALLWGMWEHYRMTQDLNFLQEMQSVFERGAEFIINHLDRETGLVVPSRDLWEEREGEHLYSAVAAWAGLKACKQALERLTGYAPGEYEEALKVLELGLTKMYREDLGRFLRSKKVIYRGGNHPEGKGYYQQDKYGYQEFVLEEDNIVDISLLGISYPFGFLPAKDQRVEATAKIIEERLTSPIVGGIHRYEGDIYAGGNPWILTTLWLSLYYREAGNLEKAESLYHWAREHATPLGLFPEQINKETGKAAWVVPLTWSHAMYVLYMLKRL